MILGVCNVAEIKECCNFRINGFFRNTCCLESQQNILTKQLDKPKSIYVLIPIFGTVIFLLLYIIATLLYPGGSQVDKNSIGFSWINNYWCNLLNKNAINGQFNPAKPVALTGMFILCLTLTFFWFIFPKQINVGKSLKLIIQISGALAMIVAFFLFTSINHDIITNLASSFGAIATVGTFIGLYKNNCRRLFFFGLFNILLVVLNNYVYYNKDLIIYLPVVQKITFATFLLWICCIDVTLYRYQVVKDKNNL